VTAEDIVHGWKPPQKPIGAGTKVLAFGNCFAEYFVKFLTLHGYNRWRVPVERNSYCEENLLLELRTAFENIFVILQQFRWAFNEFTPKANLWFAKDKHLFEATVERQEKVRRSLLDGDVFIITLGLSEVWFDRVEGEPMWRTIPAQYYEAGRHVCRPATVAETLKSLYDFDALVEEFLPGKRFIFALSPIPLHATFRDQSAVTANQSSKAILRAALDEFFADSAVTRKSRYHYFPSYEIVFNLFDHPFLADNRHIRPEVAEAVMGIFGDLYTDLPAGEIRIPERDSLVRRLEERIHGLESELEAKECVIRELDRAARERLALINRLSQVGEPQPAPEIHASATPGPSAGPGMANFSSLHYQAHNRARLDHLQSLGLPLSDSRVLELGSGPGDHTGFYVDRRCTVVSVDAREECLDALARRFPGVRTVRCDLNEPGPLRELGSFDIVHCFGILYHLENPEALLQYMGEACTGFAIVETCVNAARTSAVEPVDEIRDDFTQALDGRACRPARQWVFDTLGRFFPFVYHTKTQPDHPEFPIDWSNLADAPQLVRSVFVASKRPLELPALSSKLLDIQERAGT
jgi:2-polyprenyl-3-methyl-5-hydroxy-6-metoxy-1,4-benzoquinol methylase